ncbi:MAG: ATP-binding cassette domain-containing protein [Clostridia bacterium]|nr:ATP-binding cassette domain-containing protein [Clostridia bacterium]
MSDLLRVENLNKEFGDHHVLIDVNCRVQKGEFISILGPSGCGKTTLLRTICGLESPTSGRIYHEEKDITDLRPDKRGFSIVFQDYALFPHMTLYDNVAYGLKLRKKPAEEIKERVMTTLKMLRLDAAVKKLPSQMSGGMQQRAAIARSLVLDCDLLLLDEPFSALDAVVKVDLSAELKDLQKQFDITMMMVTHDQEEAFSLSDRIILMNHGVIEADAPPKELYETEGNPFIQTFIIDQINKRARYIWDLKRGSAGEPKATS